MQPFQLLAEIMWIANADRDLWLGVDIGSTPFLSRRATGPGDQDAYQVTAIAADTNPRIARALA